MITTKQLKALAGLQKLVKRPLTIDLFQSGHIYITTPQYSVRIKTSAHIPVDTAIPLTEVQKLGELLSIEPSTEGNIIINGVYKTPHIEPRYKEYNYPRIFDQERLDIPSNYDAEIPYVISKIAKVYCESKYFHIQQNGEHPGVIDLTDEVRIIVAPVRVPEVAKV